MLRSRSPALLLAGTVAANSYVRSNGVTLEGRTITQMLADLATASQWTAPTGTGSAPGLAIRDATSGIYSPAAHSLAFRNAYQGSDADENHGEVKISHRHGIVIGPATGTNAERQPNQSALEISLANNGPSGVPITIAEYQTGGGAVEPMIFLRYNAASVGGAESAVVAGSGVASIQGQVRDGLGTANIAIASIRIGVPSAAVITPSAGNINTYPGEIIFAQNNGDGSTGGRNYHQFTSTGHHDILIGGLRLAGVDVIRSDRIGQFVAQRPPVRPTIADDAIYQLAVPLGSLAIVDMIANSLSATAPALSFACRVDSSPACEKGWVTPLADAAGNVVFQTGVVSDFTTCADGKLTISAGNDGSVYIINRLGGSRVYGIHQRLYQIT